MTDIRLGSRGDSYYEYLVKQYLQTNRTEGVYQEMYEHAFDSIKSTLLDVGTRTNPPLVYTVELVPRPGPQGPGWHKLPKQDHLVCFLGGTMMLGAAASLPPPLAPPRTARGASRAAIEDWRVGHELTRTCVNTYTSARTGLGPEIAFFWPPNSSDTHAREWTVKRYVSWLTQRPRQRPRADRRAQHPAPRDGRVALHCLPAHRRRDLPYLGLEDL